MLFSLLPFAFAVKLFPVLHWALAGVGILLLARLFGISRAGGWVGAATYAFSGVVVSEVFFPHILPGMMLLPWIVWALARPSSFASRTILLSALLALGVLAGDPFTLGMAILAGLGWIALAADPADRRSSTLALAAAAGLAALAGLPQILATALWVPETNRAVTGITWREALQFSIPPWRLLELVIPYPFGAVWTNDRFAIWGWRLYSEKLMGLFLTLYAGALGPIALVATWRHKTPVARFGRFLVLTSVVLSAAWTLVPAAWRDQVAPLALRNPEKFAVLLPFGLAVLAGAALDELRKRPRLPRWILGAAIVLTVLAACAAIAPRAAGRLAIQATRSRPDLEGIAAKQLPGALAESASLWLATALGLELARSRGGALVGGLALLTLVPIAANRRIGWTFRQDEVFAPPAFVRYMQKQDPEGRYRALGEMAYRPPGALEAAESGNDLGFLDIVRRNFDQHSQVLWGRGAVFNGDFDNGDLSRIESVRKLSGMAERFPDASAFFGSLALRWGIRYRDQVPPVAGFSRVRDQGPDAWDENPGALPDIRLVTGWKEEPDVLAALRDVGTLPPGSIVVETGRTTLGAAAAGSVRILEKSPERLVVETESEAPAWLFVLRGFWRHRVVRVDGREVEVVPAQLAFSAVAVPAGRHRVEWEESLPGWGVSRFGPPIYGAGDRRALRGLPAPRDGAPHERRSGLGTELGWPWDCRRCRRTGRGGAHGRSRWLSSFSWWPPTPIPSSHTATSSGETSSRTTCRWRRPSTTRGRVVRSRSGGTRSREDGRCCPTRMPACSTRRAWPFPACPSPWRCGCFRSRTGSWRDGACCCSRAAREDRAPRPGSPRSASPSPACSSPRSSTSTFFRAPRCCPGRSGR